MDLLVIRRIVQYTHESDWPILRLVNKIFHQVISECISEISYPHLDNHLLEKLCFENKIFSLQWFISKMTRLELRYPSLRSGRSVLNASDTPLRLQSYHLSWDWGLYAACQGGYVLAANLMIGKGANNWNWSLGGACLGGHLSLANLMIEKGAHDWNYGLYKACQGGHLHLVNLMIEKGVDDWNSGLEGACEGGHTSLIKLMIRKGADRCLACTKPISQHYKKMNLPRDLIGGL